MFSTPLGETLQLHVGTVVPALVLPSIDGGSAVSMSAFRGDRLLLHLFASW